jgi:serine/threonine protein kinase
MAYTFKHGDRPLDGYTIQRAVGRGGFGEVYYALSDGGREVALKYLRENPDVELRGVSHCINLKSPHLVSIFDVKRTHDGEYIIIMEYCSGPSLRDLMIAEPNGFSTEKAAFFARETGKGLSYLHERGIVHRDLKPGNLFFDDGYVKIGDYGLSKFISVSRHSAQTASVGTVHYMAPEIGSGNYSRGVDIYALGVMLYEMLLGKVPFEGSSMAEVLMKHLTAQPELDQLPKPFGHVIRKALEKDPNDRYQTVDEMIEEMLSGEQIQKSLAGFSPKSLPGAVARGGSDPAASPYPSPNPLPSGMPTMPIPPRPPAQPGSGMPMPDRLAKKLDKVSRKIEKKMSKLAGKIGTNMAKGGVDIRSPQQPQPPFAANVAGGGNVPWATPAPPASLGAKRFMLTGLLTVGLAVGLGLWVGIASDLSYGEELGVAAGLLVVAMRLSLFIASKACSWFGVSDGPDWAQHMVTACTAAPLLALGAVPAIEYSGGLAVFLGLVLSSAFANWLQLAEDNTGEVRFGPIFGKALGALILTAISCAFLSIGREEEFILTAAGVAAAVAFIVQAGASLGGWTPQNASGSGEGSAPPPPPTSGDRQAQSVSEQDTPTWPANPAMAAAQAASSAAFAAAQGQGAIGNGLRLRGGFTRFFWALMAFVLSGGAIATFMITMVGNISYEEQTGAIIGNVACFVFALFAMTKATPFAKIGFWRGMLRPFMMTLFAFGIGATSAAVARNWDHCEEWGEELSSSRVEGMSAVMSSEETELSVSKRGEETAISLRGPATPILNTDVGLATAKHLENAIATANADSSTRECLRYTLNTDSRGGLVTGLVLCSLGFLALLFLTGRKAKAPQTFLQGSAT